MYDCHVSIMYGMKLPDIGIGYPLMVLYSHTFHNNLSTFENTVKLQPSKKKASKHVLTCGGEHNTALHHFGLPLSHTHKVHVSGPGT
jgi:hypothetical protein